tara:strand:+ start:547 stop:804 length:258 start_codon:yes stop_codon:yes gene_type:complete
MKNIPKIEIKIIIGYSNFAILLSFMNNCDEFSTKKVEIKINILKKEENLSLIKLSENIFKVPVSLLKIKIIDIKIISEDNLVITL